MNVKKALFIGSGVIAVLAIITAIVVLVLSKGGKTLSALTGKIDENKAKTVAETYLDALSTGDSEKMFSVYDLEGYFIFKKVKEKGFDQEFDNKSEFIKNYLETARYENLDKAKENIGKNFEDVQGYYSYKIEEYNSIKNSEESKNIIVVNATVKRSTKNSTIDKKIDIYMLKNNGDYKVVYYTIQ